MVDPPTAADLDYSWIVIIDPEPTALTMATALREMKRRVTVVGSAREAEDLLTEAKNKPAFALLELYVQEGLSLPFLPSLRQASPLTHFLVVTAYGSVAGAVHALRLGAEDFRCKPLSPGELSHLLAAPDTGDELPPLVHPSLDRAVWEYIQLALCEEGTKAGAARRLGIQPRSLRRMLQKAPPR